MFRLILLLICKLTQSMNGWVNRAKSSERKRERERMEETNGTCSPTILICSHTAHQSFSAGICGQYLSNFGEDII